MAYGWISIHRKIQQSDIWLDKEPFDKRSAWIDLIMMANHEDRQVLFDEKFIEVKRGEKITSLRMLSEKWKWSRSKVKRFLKLLESGSMIELKIDHQKTTYKIVNYNVYQNEDLSKRPQKDHKKTTDGPQTDTNNNINNELIMNNNTTGVVPPPAEMDLDNPKLAELIKLYQDCGFGLITPYSANMLRDYMNEYSYEWVKEAIEIAEQNGVRTLAYIRGVLNKKKTGVDKPRSFNKKQTYYRPKQQEEIKKDNQFNNSFQTMQNAFSKMRKEKEKENAKLQ
ncbi:MAG: DnaD domain protein [Finegoldia magna]|nr:DnaD domain protein [Finegoldia magna]